MSIDKPGKGRGAFLPEVLEYRARISFYQALERFESGNRYRPVVEKDLRDLFLKTGAQKYVLDQYMIFDEWIRDERGFLYDEAKPYLTALKSFIVDRLRCTTDGNPPYWLLHTVHADVSRTDQFFGKLDLRFRFPTPDSKNLA